MSGTTLYAVCDKTRKVLISIVSDDMDNTIPLESKLEAAWKAVPKYKVDTLSV